MSVAAAEYLRDRSGGRHRRWPALRHEARSRLSCEAALARVLVEAGVPDQPWQTVNVAGTVCLRGKSLHRLAQRTVVEPDNERLRQARFQPRPAVGTASLAASEAPEVVGVARAPLRAALARHVTRS